MAREFDGVNDALEASDSGSIRSPSTAITVAVWMQRTSTGADPWTGLVLKKYTITDPWISYSIQQNANNTAQFYFSISTGVPGSLIQTAFSANPSVPADTWRLLVGRWAQGEKVSLRIFDLNRNIIETVESTAISNITIGYNADPLRFGRNEANNYWQGRLANILIENSKLSDQQILGRMFLPSFIHNPSAGFWPLWGITSPEPDLSGNKNDATVTEATRFNHPPIMLFTPKWAATMPLIETGAPPVGQPFYIRDSYSIPDFLGNQQG